MRRQAQPPQPEDKRLRDVLWCVKDGFRKLVPTDRGAPPFTQYGNSNSEHNEYYDVDADTFLVVGLHAWYSSQEKKWVCCITIADGDDFIFQRWSDFTWENWRQQIDLYEQIKQFDGDMFDLLSAEGFS